MKEARDHHRVSPEGKAMGKQLARLADTEWAALARSGEADDRCKTCAFRAGTVPNGCLQTQMDAFKAVAEDIPFMCHCELNANGRATKICGGWFAVRRIAARAERARGGKLTPAPWDFSPPDAPEAP